ncbi:MAG: cell division protein FtsA, partial [Candidatus Competibacteraceae bacterium]|nr:cell division protein FtsA [Candidatus Competibacteraceae bacterium]
AGLVLTGGSAKMEGVVELAEDVFHMPVRLGLPHDVTGMEDLVRNPVYSTAVGLLLFGNENRPLRVGPVSRVGQKGLWSRMKSWFQGNF